jgi:hypothetical protein
MDCGDSILGRDVELLFYHIRKFLWTNGTEVVATGE